MLDIATYTGGIAETNGYLCHLNDAQILIDAPDGIADWLRTRGASVDALLLTHAHFDHVLDAAAVQEGWKCPTYAFTDPTPELTLEAMLASAGPSLQVRPYSVDHHVVEGEPLTLAGTAFDVLHIPGHSPDSVTFAPEGTGVLFGGDVLFQMGIGRDDLPGGDGALLRRGIREKLYELDDDLQVYPGHGASTTIGAEKRSNPFVRM